MSIVTQIENNDGLEFHIDESSQMVYASVSATARMLDIAKSTVSKCVSEISLLRAEIQTPYGLRSVSLLSASQVAKLALQYNPSLAEKMLECGANVFMLGLSGYKVQAVEQPVELSRKDLALMVIAECDRADALAAQIEADRGRTLVGAAIEAAESGNLTIGEFAKNHKIGRNTLFGILRDLKIFMQDSTLPYQSGINSGYFTVSQVTKNERIFTFALVTPKGQTWLVRKLADYNQAQLAVVQVEAAVSLV